MNTLTRSLDGNSPKNEVPCLAFIQGRRAPSFPPTFEHNWTSYYEWRGLPHKSPAALLLHWLLSIYRLLYLLGFISSEGDGSERRKLNIHCLGVEMRSSIIFWTKRPTDYQFRSN